MKLKLNKPLAIFDIESTGTNRKTDRIIDLAIVKLMPDGSRQTKEFRVHPERPIPPDSTAVHGITDEDVKDCPVFKDVAPAVVAFIEDCDLGGYNVLRFDIPLLAEEFRRAETPFSMEARHVVDAQRIFHQKEPRDLTAALSFYCNEMHLDAHGAMGDVDATIRVIEGQLERYDDVPRDVDALSEYCNPKNPNWVDGEGKLTWDAEGEVLINFGQNQGKKLKDLALYEQSFLQWILRKDFSEEVQTLVRNALKGEFPRRENNDPAPGGA